MRKRHNKKRNTAFLYEILVRELTKAIVEKASHKKRSALKLIKEFYYEGSVLYKELELYGVLLESANLEARTAERILYEAKYTHSRINPKAIFEKQSQLISKINKEFGKEVWNTFVPNFKSLASISSVFNLSTKINQRVLYEDTIIKRMASSELEEHNLKSIDNIVFYSFVEKFNDKYDTLLKEQKDLLNKYINSFADNGLELKIYLNEEVARLKKEVTESLELEEIRVDEEMMSKATGVVGLLKELKGRDLDERVITSILKIQELVKEINSDD